MAMAREKGGREHDDEVSRHQVKGLGPGQLHLKDRIPAENAAEWYQYH
jgi:hypothetical protein